GLDAAASRPDADPDRPGGGGDGTESPSHYRDGLRYQAGAVRRPGVPGAPTPPGPPGMDRRIPQGAAGVGYAYRASDEPGLHGKGNAGHEDNAPQGQHPYRGCG